MTNYRISLQNAETNEAKLKLADGMPYKGKAIKSFNKEKKQWSWKLI